MSPLTFGAWNVCTLMDKAQVDRPERRKALVGRELARYNADIAAHSKTCLTEEGQLMHDSWMHPSSKHWHLIDFVIVKKRDRQDVWLTKSMCGADCWTDHRLSISKMNLRILPKRCPQGKTAPKSLDISKLKKSETKQQLTEELENLAVNIQITDNIEDSWATFHNTVYASDYGSLGPSKRKHQDRFEDNSEQMNNVACSKGVYGPQPAISSQVSLLMEQHSSQRIPDT